MALLKLSEIREMSPETRSEKLKELRDELMHERGIGAMGGAPASPGKIRALRKNIARILTVQKEATAASQSGKKAVTSKPPKREAGS
jgi:large subunit ribosomal protein L29